jgi:hypothetical protein
VKAKKWSLQLKQCQLEVVRSDLRVEKCHLAVKKSGFVAVQRGSRREQRAPNGLLARLARLADEVGRAP